MHAGNAETIAATGSTPQTDANVKVRPWKVGNYLLPIGNWSFSYDEMAFCIRDSQETEMLVPPTPDVVRR